MSAFEQRRRDMNMMMRTGSLALAAAFVMACGGSTDPIETAASGQSGLAEKKGSDPKKLPPEQCPKPADPNAAGDCTWWGDGNDTSCKSPDVWKDYAAKDCSAKGGTLQDIAFGGTCAGGNVSSMKYLCCVGGAEDPGTAPPKEPPPPEEPSSCIYDSANHTCQSEAAWKNYAYQTCVKQGLQLTHIAYDPVACGKNGEVGSIKFNCCK
jgi:hypothetical protein